MNFIKFLLFYLFSCCILSAAEVVLLQSTDIHGQMSEESYQPGIERIGAKIQEFRKIYGKNLIVFDCGDLTQGSYSATLDHGKSMIQALNYLKYDPIPSKLYIAEYKKLYPEDTALLEHFKLPMSKQRRIAFRVSMKVCWKYLRYKIKHFFD